MRKNSAGKPASVHDYLTAKADPVILHADFDAIEEAEGEAIRQIEHGHSFSAEIQGRKPKS